MRTLTITRQDFDNAVKQPWSTQVCVVAQAFILRQDYKGEWPQSIVNGIMSTFDEHFRLPGDEKKPELQAIRAALPISCGGV